MNTRLRYALIVMITALFALAAYAQPADKWVAAWAGSVQGPYPVGNPSAQPDMRFAFPSADKGARDQTFRMIVRPDIWGPATRLRFSNALGTKSVTFDGVFVGLQRGSSAVIAGTNQPVSFAGKASVTVGPGKSVWSDPVALPFAEKPDAIALMGRRLAVSFHVVGESGPMTWHAKAMNTSYVSEPGAGSVGQSEDESAFPFSTASWYFLDAVDMMASADTQVVVAVGDSITDGTGTTMNGDDRWPDVLARRLHAAYGNRISVVNAGIGGNQVVGPSTYLPQKPYAGGPSAQARVERDVIGLSGVTTVIWLQGINDFSKNGNASVEDVQASIKEVVSRLRAKLPGVRVVGATVTSALGSTSAAHGHVEQNDKRRALNDFVRNSELFDGFVDFDKVMLDTSTGAMRAEFVPDSTTGGPGDKLHPNRAGHLAMGTAIDLALVAKQ
ncbi:GDSL-type esterase/lipase family protein [Variovorax guangxiensis]|uniref:GDSL-type esterase/lipase family protein n=1 Tax=Variovorax guangxiensis TaxID=1775474 RepID=UPI0028543599|nr:GDSL-type esterase/lipase family protein [Variovorax guangxiensis]MDR6859844.1 lysophospholipase L1-like esterase [Variovorax guangxiensis]